MFDPFGQSSQTLNSSGETYRNHSGSGRGRGRNSHYDNKGQHFRDSNFGKNKGGGSGRHWDSQKPAWSTSNQTAAHRNRNDPFQINNQTQRGFGSRGQSDDSAYDTMELELSNHQEFQAQTGKPWYSKNISNTPSNQSNFNRFQRYQFCKSNYFLIVQ